MDDGGKIEYSFQFLIDHKKVLHLQVLKKYCNFEQWNKIVKHVLQSFDECFIQLITCTTWFEYARDESVIEHMLDISQHITDQQWINLYINLLKLLDDYNDIITLLEKYMCNINLHMYFEILSKVYFLEHAKPVMKIFRKYWFFDKFTGFRFIL